MDRPRRRIQWIPLFFTILILFLLIPPQNAEAKTAPQLNKKSLLLVQGQKYQLKVSGVKASRVTWKSSNPSVATVKTGRVTARKRGNARITAAIGQKKWSCKIRVSEKPMVIASTTVTGEKEQYVTALVIGIEGKHSAKLTTEVKLKTPGKGQMKLKLLDAEKTMASEEGKVYWKKGMTVRPGGGERIATAFYARKDYRPFTVTKKSKVVLYFRYDGVDFKTVVTDLTGQQTPKACKLTRLTPY
jgi:hypothetical protein